MEFFPDGYALSGMACVAAADFHQQTTSCQERPGIGLTRSIQLYNHQIELVSSLLVPLLERKHILLRRCRQYSAHRMVSKGACVFGACVRSTNRKVRETSNTHPTPSDPLVGDPPGTHFSMGIHFRTQNFLIWPTGHATATFGRFTTESPVEDTFWAHFSGGIHF